MRNVNPTNVHSWWYRRRPLARKLKIKIPREEYDLDVGVPPALPEIEEVKAEISIEINEIPASESSDIGSGMSSSLLGMSDAQTSTSDSLTCATEQPSLAKNPQLSAEMNAYMRSSSPFRDFSWLVPSSTSRHSTSRHSTHSRDSSLPPSSPPLPTSSPPPFLLTFPEDMIVDDDPIGRFLGISLIFKVFVGSSLWPPDSIPTEHNKICSSTSYVPRTFSNRLPQIETSETTKPVSLPLFLSWCFSGYRNSYDGSFLGFCSCFADDNSRNHKAGIFASIFNLVS